MLFVVLENTESSLPYVFPISWGRWWITVLSHHTSHCTFLNWNVQEKIRAMVTSLDSEVHLPGSTPWLWAPHSVWLLEASWMGTAVSISGGVPWWLAMIGLWWPILVNPGALFRATSIYSRAKHFNRANSCFTAKASHIHLTGDPLTLSESRRTLC